MALFGVVVVIDGVVIDGAIGGVVVVDGVVIDGVIGGVLDVIIDYYWLLLMV